MALRAEDPEPHAQLPGHDRERQRAGPLRHYLPAGGRHEHGLIYVTWFLFAVYQPPIDGGLYAVFCDTWFNLLFCCFTDDQALTFALVDFFFLTCRSFQPKLNLELFVFCFTTPVFFPV